MIIALLLLLAAFGYFAALNSTSKAVPSEWASCTFDKDISFYKDLKEDFSDSVIHLSKRSSPIIRSAMFHKKSALGTWTLFIKCNEQEFPVSATPEFKTSFLGKCFFKKSHPNLLSKPTPTL